MSSIQHVLITSVLYRGKSKYMKKYNHFLNEIEGGKGESFGAVFLGFLVIVAIALLILKVIYYALL